ncbi:MAG TPA: cupin domain-containing protein [Lentimicrobium sp.]|jgi:cupin 2 domain-containing protein|nr:cupin domain-containing protein [Lentimicrobium sp.]
MEKTKGNIFKINVPKPDEPEKSEKLTGGDVLIERIVSRGHVTAPGEWYDQEKDEWVVLLTGEAGLEYENGTNINLRPGDYLFIPARKRHRVTYTSTEPPCIWLAVHGNLIP